MKAIGQSIVKANNDVYDNGIHRPNEDAIKIEKSILAISDGAGGIGILADLWSQELVDYVPNKPFSKAEEIDDWLGAFWEDFYEVNKHKLQSDPWKIDKFDNEGSLATLSVLWELSRNTFVYQSYGDSALFIFNRKTKGLRIQDNLKSVNSFDTSPPLINWQNEKHDSKDFYQQEFKLKSNEIIILATDGIAMYLHGAYLASNKLIKEDVVNTKMQKIVDYYTTNPIVDFNKWLQELRKSLKKEERFRNLTNDWYKNKALDNDDYTMAFVGYSRK